MIEGYKLDQLEVVEYEDEEGNKHSGIAVVKELPIGSEMRRIAILLNSEITVSADKVVEHPKRDII